MLLYMPPKQSRVSKNGASSIVSPSSTSRIGEHELRPSLALLNLVSVSFRTLTRTGMLGSHNWHLDSPNSGEDGPNQYLSQSLHGISSTPSDCHPPPPPPPLSHAAPQNVARTRHPPSPNTGLTPHNAPDSHLHYTKRIQLTPLYQTT